MGYIINLYSSIMAIADNLTKERLTKYSKNDIIHLVGAYIDVCESLGVNSDNIFIVQDVENVTFDELWVISNFIIAYESICIIHSFNKEDTNNWFKQKLEYYPFDGKTPIQYLIKSKQNKVAILQIRVFTSALLTAYKHQR